MTRLPRQDAVLGATLENITEENMESVREKRKQWVLFEGAAHRRARRRHVEGVKGELFVDSP